jgi:Predicted ATP-binding protein involved in virulence
MRVEELHLKNFRCFKELDIKFPASNLAVLIGANGSGKTAILDAISLCLCNFPEIIFPSEINKSKELTEEYKDKHKIGDIRHDKDDVFINELESSNRITIGYNKKNKICWETNFKDGRSAQLNILDHNKLSDEEGSKLFSSFIFIHYDATKNKIHSVDWKGSRNDTLSSFEGWFEAEENIENESKYNKKDFNITNPCLDAVRNAITLFLSSISNAGFHDLRVKRVFENTEKMGTYEDEVKKHSSFLVIKNQDTELKFSQLSSGQKLLLQIVVDITYRLIVNNKIVKKDENFSGVILNSEAIVLIDEIELHLHPQWQREVLPALQKTFPNIQFIVTTHSPQVLSNIKKEQVFIIEDYSLVKVTPHTQGRDSNSILYELFGVEERPEIYRDKIKAFYDVLEDENIDEAEKILTELTELFGEEDTEVVRAKLHLTFATE